MKYMDENMFSEEEKESIYSLTCIVCHILDVDLESVMGDSRKAIFSDARKIISHYAYHNLAIRRKGKTTYTLALASWFFKRDHGSINNLVRMGANLYDTDSKFRDAYDEVMSCINKNTPDPKIYKLREKEVVPVNLNWDMVRKGNYSFAVKDHYMPEAVLDKVKEMYSNGYSLGQIGLRQYISDQYVKYLTEKHEMTRKVTKDFLLQHKLLRKTQSVPKLSQSINY